MVWATSQAIAHPTTSGGTVAEAVGVRKRNREPISFLVGAARCEPKRLLVNACQLAVARIRPIRCGKVIVAALRCYV